MTRMYINDFAVMSRLGMDREQTRLSLLADAPPRPDREFRLTDGATTQIACLPEALPSDLSEGTRTNRMASALLRQCADGIGWVRSTFRADRIAVIVGSSTTGVEEAIDPFARRLETGVWEPSFRFAGQELSDLSRHIRDEIGAAGPAYTVSTACTSATKAILSGCRYIRTGLADAVICGGIDSIARLTVNGFHALSSVSAGQCAPFSRNRDGINIGEGGGLFVLSASPSDWAIDGGGETSDAYHVSSPDPTGAYAEQALRQALDQAGLSPADVDFVHMHGTGTELNDKAEADVMVRLFGPDMPAASTKGMTGHTLGAAGALQLAINLICMEHGFYPPHVYDGQRDETLAPVRLTTGDLKAPARLDRSICASYAFGGSNAALVVSRVAP